MARQRNADTNEMNRHDQGLVDSSKMVAAAKDASKAWHYDKMVSSSASIMRRVPGWLEFNVASCHDQTATHLWLNVDVL